MNLASGVEDSDKYMSEYSKVVVENKDKIKEIIEHQKQLKLDIALIRVNDSDCQADIKKIEETNRKIIESLSKECKLAETLELENNNLRDLIQIVNDRILERKQDSKLSLSLFIYLTFIIRITKNTYKQGIEDLNESIVDLQAEIRDINQAQIDTKSIGIFRN